MHFSTLVFFTFFHLCSKKLGVVFNNVLSEIFPQPSWWWWSLLVSWKSLRDYMLSRFWSLDLDHIVNFFPFFYFFLFHTFHLFSFSLFKFFSSYASFLCLLFCCWFVALLRVLFALLPHVFLALLLRSLPRMLLRCFVHCFTCCFIALCVASHVASHIASCVHCLACSSPHCLMCYLPALLPLLRYFLCCLLALLLVGW